MKRSGPLKRNTPLRAKAWGIKPKPRTEKQKNDRAELDAAKVIIWERSGGQCEFVATDLRGYVLTQDTTGPIEPGRCWREAQDAHHIKLQSQGHDHSPDNLLAICRWHHTWIHDHVGEAQKLGYLSRAKRGDL